MTQILGWIAFIIWGGTLYLLINAWNKNQKLVLIDYIGILLSVIMILLGIYINH